jgi:hypothetical protein
VGFGGDRVHANRKYRLKRFVLKIERFNRDLTLLNSSVLWASFFPINGLYWKAGKTPYIDLAYYIIYFNFILFLKIALLKGRVVGKTGSRKTGNEWT